MIKIFEVTIWSEVQRKRVKTFPVQMMVADEEALEKYRKADHENYSEQQKQENNGVDQKINIIYKFVIYDKAVSKDILRRPYTPDPDSP